jgi:hypothetical protein
MTKIIARKIIARKYILVLVGERTSWWSNSCGLIIVVLMRRIKNLLVMISFPTVAFIIDGFFKNISIDFRIFLGSILILIIAKTSLHEW